MSRTSNKVKKRNVGPERPGTEPPIPPAHSCPPLCCQMDMSPRCTFMAMEFSFPEGPRRFVGATGFPGFPWTRSKGKGERSRGRAQGTPTSRSRDAAASAPCTVEPYRFGQLPRPSFELAGTGGSRGKRVIVGVGEPRGPRSPRGGSASLQGVQCPGESCLRPSPAPPAPEPGRPPCPLTRHRADDTPHRPVL